MSDVKYFSFQLNKKKHKHLIDWMKRIREEKNVNISSMVRQLLQQEFDKQNGKTYD